MLYCRQVLLIQYFDPKNAKEINNLTLHFSRRNLKQFEENKIFHVRK